MNALALLLNSLWQAAAVAALVWVVLKYAPRVNAATRYVIWWAALAIVLLLPLAPALIPRPAPKPAIVASSTGAPVNPMLPEFEIPAMVTMHAQSSSPWLVTILALWSALFLWGLARIVRSWLWLTRVKARATLSPQCLPATCRNARLLLSVDVASPIAVGFFKPAVILPASLPSELEPRELNHVLLHESAHLARFDDWTNLAARLLGTALALHPVALWVLRQIEREREIACDDWVVSRTGQARSYATSLARMYERRWPNQLSLATGIFGRGSSAFQRIELLLKQGREFSPRVSIARIVCGGAALLALAAASPRAPRWIAFAQQAPRPSFEVASIKPGDPNAGGRFGIGFRGVEFVTDNAPLKLMIGFAYDVQYHQMFGGPKWIDTDRFTIRARPAGAVRPAPDNTPRIRLMLQSLLEERFKLALHRETRIQQVYELSVAKGGPKLKPSAGPGRDGREGIFGRGRGETTATNMPISALVGFLSQRLGSSVIDKTGLSGKYDFTLSFLPEPNAGDLALFGPPPPDAQTPADSGRPSIFSALPEQLGLKLESARGPVEVLIIDHADKPDAN